MAKSWKDLLSDTKTFGDDFVLDIGGDKLSLGDLRKANADSHGQLQRTLDTRKTELDEKEKLLTTAQGELATLFQTFSDKTGLSIEDVTKGKTITSKEAKTIVAGAGLDPNDPILGPVIQQLTELKDKEIAGIKNEMSDMKRALGLALKVNLDDHYEREFSSLSKDIPEGVKDLTIDKALKYAADNKIMDRHGRFNLTKAVSDLTSDARGAKAIADAEERGRVKAMDEIRAGSLNRPGAVREQLTTSPKNKDGSTKTIEQAIQDAGNDPEIWNNALRTAGAGSVQ